MKANILIGLGIGACMVTEAALLLSIVAFRFYLKFQNKKRAEVCDAVSGVADTENIEFLDLTDKQNARFVYVY